MKKDSQQSLREKLQEYDLRLTPQRDAIFRAIHDSDRHPTADAVYRVVRKKFPNISFDTVNRTLGTFSEIGLLHVVEGYGEPRRYDPNTGRHHHFRCMKCGVITDFVYEVYDNLEIPKDLQARFLILGRKVLLEGVCGKCRKRGRSIYQYISGA